MNTDEIDEPYTCEECGARISAYRAQKISSMCERCAAEDAADYYHDLRRDERREREDA